MTAMSVALESGPQICGSPTAHLGEDMVTESLDLLPLMPTDPTTVSISLAASITRCSLATGHLQIKHQVNKTAKMDPYSAEGELINIHNHFHQGQYQEVIDFDTSSFSPENALPARVLALRSQIALGNAQDVLADVKGESEPELQVLGALAQFTLGKVDAAVQTVEKVASSAGDNATVQVIGGTVLQNAGKSEEALALLSQHSGSRTYKGNLYALDMR